MKLSLNWLKAYVNFSLHASEVAALLTQRGLEVTHITPSIKSNLEGLRVGEVLSCVPHPNADHLKQTLVHVGQEQPLTIVCGAPNVAIGQKVVVATVGAVLHPYPDQVPFQIKKSKIRGIVSEGMLCAASEIGLGPEQEGIIVLSTTLPAGTAANVWFKDALDTILEVEITPNRADACSHLGIARELKAILHLPMTYPSVEAFATDAFASPLQLGAIDASLCPQYCGVLLKDVVVQPSPNWLRIRLEQIGVKPINSIVDITNFILHDIGQPLHAFDFDQIKGGTLTVQKLPSGTLFVGLDGIERTLTGQETMICDAEGPIAMAGIIGGLRTCIQEHTQRVFIESAYFTPDSIRIASQIHHLKTDASFRFERGTDPNMPLYALKRAVLLVKERIPAALASEVIMYHPTPINHFRVPLTYARINQLLGTPMDPIMVKQILRDLEIDIASETDKGFVAYVPPYRVDVTREVDLIEEIARLYGYDAVPINDHLATAYVAPQSTVGQAYKMEQEIAALLVGNGYTEIWTNSLSKSAYNSTFPTSSVDGSEAVALLNPLSSATDVLRSILLFGGLEVLAYNLARNKKDALLFEFGTVYEKKASTYFETKKLALWLTGETEACNWVRQLGPIRLESVRHMVEQITTKLGIADLTYAPITHPYYEQAAQATHNGTNMVTFGSVHPSILQHFCIEQPVFTAEMNWNQLLAVQKVAPTYAPVSRFPAVTRDLSLVLDQPVSFQSIKDLVQKQGYKTIRAMDLVDVYQGAQLPAGKKSYAIRFVLQDQTKTLEDKNIDKLMQQLMQVFERVLHAIIRR